MTEREVEGRPEPGARPVTLESIVDIVGAGILDVMRAPLGLAVPVGEIVIFDPRDRRGIERGDVVLGVGVDPHEREAAALIRRAGAAGAAAVVFKLGPDTAPADVLDASIDAGVAVAGVSVDIVWGQLHALVRSACAAAGMPGEIGPGGTPVGDLFVLANAIASMVGGATTIEDTRSTVLAYSSTDAPIDEPRRRTILGRRVPEDWLRRLNDDGVFRRLSTGDVVRVDYSATDPDYRTRLAIAVRAGGEILGTIWVVEGDQPLDTRAEAALAEAGRIAALHLLRHRAGDDLERRRRAELFRAVLDGRTPPDVLASSLGVPTSSSVTVLAFEVFLDVAPTPADKTMVVDRALSSITIHFEAYRRQVATVAESHVIYVLLRDAAGVDGAGVDGANIASFAASVVEYLANERKIDARVGIGSTVEGFHGILRSRQEADQALRTLRVAPAASVAHIDTIRSRATLLSLRDLALERPDLRTGKVERLVAYDRDRHGVYVRTLRAYLDAFGDVSAAAASLNVRPNTFRYRLRRLLEVAGIDLDDPSERLIAHLQLTFLDADDDAAT